jgi:hypothetical protein
VIDTTQEVARAYGAQCTPDFFGFNAQDELQYRGRLDASRMTPIANARRDLFGAMKQIADTGYGPKEATSIHGFDQMESLRCVWLSAFVGGAGRQLCVPKSHPFYLADQKNNGSFVEYERENDNARANGTVLHQKCSPATAEGGRVLVHNCVHAGWQDQKPGVNGFRCWTTRTGRHSNMEPCDCGWSGLPQYRIAGEGYENPPNVTGGITPS